MVEHEDDRPSGPHSAGHSPSLKTASKSPVLPLAPLEYLQNQRRGSITDPSLHAVPLNQKPNPNSPLFRQTNDSSAPTSSTPGPSSSFVFGDATANANDNSALRKILRSPSTENENTRAVDGQERYMSSEDSRRASIAGQDQQMAGMKRKVSTDRGILGETQLAGPGVSGMEVEMEAPPPKRRGSAVDTSRIAQLTLNDRRNSVDSRANSHWGGWANERRDSSSSIFSAVSGYSSAFSGTESPQGRAPPGIAAFAWPANSPHPPTESNMQHDDPNPRPFDSNSSLHMMPPMNFNPDRRMSVPNVLSGPPPQPPATGPSRVLRSRSRPPSRQMRAENSQSTPSSTQDDASAAPSPNSTSASKANKDSSVTPYSRSPELRVSHKLAERKRRKEMKDLFDELRDQLPADRGMKASKWEILSKAIDFVNQLKMSHQEMQRQIEMLKAELDSVRGLPVNFATGPPPPHVVYGHGPPIPAPYPLPAGVMPHGAPHPGQHPLHPSPQPPQPQSQPQPQPPHSRPASSQSQNVFTPGGQNGPPTQNGNMARPES